MRLRLLPMSVLAGCAIPSSEVCEVIEREPLAFHDTTEFGFSGHDVALLVDHLVLTPSGETGVGSTWKDLAAVGPFTADGTADPSSVERWELGGAWCDPGPKLRVSMTHTFRDATGDIEVLATWSWLAEGPSLDQIGSWYDPPAVAPSVPEWALGEVTETNDRLCAGQGDPEVRLDWGVHTGATVSMDVTNRIPDECSYASLLATVPVLVEPTE